jgi:CobQ-like glutamine amidotransferase family enzyme
MAARAGSDLSQARLVIGHLYPELLNIYGDRGNILALARRAEWRGVGRVDVRPVAAGQPLDPSELDILCIGGGEDRKQALAARDLQRHAGRLREAVEDGLVVLAVCGGYQLLGAYYQPGEGERLPGAGILDAHTVAAPGRPRLIGNAVVESELGTIVGFENHGGRTYLGPGARPLGRVLVGGGNNGEDRGEGAVYRNCVGTYLHGSLLPKNPAFCDALLRWALARRHGPVDLPALDDELEERAHAAAGRRAREAP